MYNISYLKLELVFQFVTLCVFIGQLALFLNTQCMSSLASWFDQKLIKRY